MAANQATSGSATPIIVFWNKMIMNFKYNVNCIKEISAGKSKEEILKEESIIRKILLKNKQKLFHKRKEKYTENKFDLHKYKITKWLLLLVHLSLLIVILLLQMRISDSIESIAIFKFVKDQYITYSNSLDRNLQYINNNLNNESQKFGYENVHNNQEIYYLKDSRSESIFSNNKAKKSASKRNLSSIKDIYTFTFMQLQYLKLYVYWINNALLPTLYGNDERTLLDQNYIIGDPQLFFGVRAVNYFNNTDPYTNKIFSQLITTKIFTIFDSIGSDSYK